MMMNVNLKPKSTVSKFGTFLNRKNIVKYCKNKTFSILVDTKKDRTTNKKTEQFYQKFLKIKIPKTMKSSKRFFSFCPLDLSHQLRTLGL